MVNINKETYENNGIEVITDKFGKLWLNERHVQEKLELKNLPALTNKYDEKYIMIIFNAKSLHYS